MVGAAVLKACREAETELHVPACSHWCMSDLDMIAVRPCLRDLSPNLCLLASERMFFLFEACLGDPFSTGIAEQSYRG